MDPPTTSILHQMVNLSLWENITERHSQTIIMDHIWFVMMEKRRFMKNNHHTRLQQYKTKVYHSTKKIKMRSQIYDLLWCNIRYGF